MERKVGWEGWRGRGKEGEGEERKGRERNGAIYHFYVARNLS